MRRGRMVVLVALVLVVLGLALSPAYGQARSRAERGQAVLVPWTGWWWPWIDSRNPNHYDATHDAEKYDAYVRATRGFNPGALAWERGHHFVDPGDTGRDWWGECHAWAACSILEPEPPDSIVAGGVDFSALNLKGMLTERYYDPTYLIWGSRYDPGGPRASYDDVTPADFDRLIRFYIRDHRQALVMDRDPNFQVWNFPAYAYERESRVVDGVEHVTTTVTFTTFSAVESPTRSFTKTYTYTLNDGSPKGRWTGASVDDHPDFIWLPTGRHPQPNPQDAAIVDEILGTRSVDVARGRRATASSVEGPGYPARNAVDGNPDTRWASEYSDDQWLALDLGRRRALGTVVLRWEYAYAATYEIQVSDDNRAWQTVYTQPDGRGGVEVATVSASARLVRVHMTRRATSFGYSLWALEVYEAASGSPGSRPTPSPTLRPPTPTPPSVNLALHQPAAASSTASPATAPSRAVDGDLATRWTSAAADPQWLRVDLLASRTVRRVVLRWAEPAAADYQVQISANGRDWMTVASRQGWAGDTDAITFTPATARFVRLYGTRRGGPGGYSLKEFEVYP